MVQYGVSVGQLAAGQAIAKFHPFDGVALTMQIDVKALAAAPQHVASGGLDEALVILPGLPGSGIISGSFLEVPIAIELVALQAADDNMGIMPEAVVKDLLYRSCQFFRMSVRDEFAVLAVGNLSRLQGPPVRRGENHRHVPGNVFDIVAAPEIRLAGPIIILAQAAGNSGKPHQAN